MVKIFGFIRGKYIKKENIFFLLNYNFFMFRIVNIVFWSRKVFSNK